MNSTIPEAELISWPPGRVLLSGGAGFIGSNFLIWAAQEFPSVHFTCLDGLTYAGNMQSIARLTELPNFEFCHCHLENQSEVELAVEKSRPDVVFHLAAETHVDRSIKNPRESFLSNTAGSFNLLEACRIHWKNDKGKRFIQVSTDEVYGSISVGKFNDKTGYDPKSPYSASKAAADHFVNAYVSTYGFPGIVTHCTNNYGPRQFPEKLLPLFVLRACQGKSLPIYGNGDNVREWIYVDDHVKGLWNCARYGHIGETYLFGSGEERTNLEIVHKICERVAQFIGKPYDEIIRLIEFVPDRPGHDHRYAVDSSKAIQSLNWKPSVNLDEGLDRTIRWYLENQQWVQSVQDGSYQKWIESQYGEVKV